ncbi:MAG: YkgJ family cysteine cluster protein [Promethearchaeota archaeon]
MVNDKFWEVVKEFNLLMKSAIKGPNCLDICNGDCCSIKIDVPKLLAQEYIERGYAVKTDFVRSDVFSLKLRFDEKKGKCFLFNKEINGCSVHNSGIKPPQCWIYPTNFSNSENNDLSCKKAGGWKIVDPEKAIDAERLLKYYVFLCKLEARKEQKNVINRINKSMVNRNLQNLLKKISPSQISGFKDSWDCISLLPAEGISLQLKKLCLYTNPSCELVLYNNFLECKSICAKVTENILFFLQQTLQNYVNKNGADINGEYLFNDLKLKDFSVGE